MIVRRKDWFGYADAKPSESIQPHELPGLAVAVIFPFGQSLDPPVKQYKNSKNKITACQRLTKWLDDERRNGLRLVGSVNCCSQMAAADFGLRLMEELPEACILPHYDGFRLYFGKEYLDLSQAVAIIYYIFALDFACLRAGTLVQTEQVALTVLMDRFPGVSPPQRLPGFPIQLTQGEKFLHFFRQNSATGRGLQQENKTIGLVSNMKSLSWWRESAKVDWRIGKDHPNFILPDWLAAAAIASRFRDEFVMQQKNQVKGHQLADALCTLYRGFKEPVEFELWSMEDDVFGHIVPENTLWSIPRDARQYILDRATSSVSGGETLSEMRLKNCTD